MSTAVVWPLSERTPTRGLSIRDFRQHPQFLYAQDVSAFQEWRLRYYAHTHFSTHLDAQSVLLHDLQTGLLSKNTRLEKAFQQLARTRAEVLIITPVSPGRTLAELAATIFLQSTARRVAWLILDNGLSEEEDSDLKKLILSHSWIVRVSYSQPFGYAAPVRNRGLLITQHVFFSSYRPPYVMLIDSDDSLQNPDALKELLAVAISHRSAVMVHGFAVCAFEDFSCKIVEMDTIPRRIDNHFPAVRTLKDEFDAGPQLLASVFPAHLAGWFHYPDEFTFEDDALNQRIMLWARKRREHILAVEFPCVLKRFHTQSMSGRNSLLGSQEVTARLGKMVVTGIRASVVEGLIHLRDYFTREGL